MKNTIIQFKEGDFTLAVGRYEAHRLVVEKCLEAFKALDCGDVTNEVFNAVLNATPEAVAGLYHAKINAEIAKTTKDPELAAMLRGPKLEPLNRWIQLVGQMVPLAKQMQDTRLVLLNERMKYEGGAVKIDNEAVKEDFTIRMSDSGQKLHQMALDVKSKMEEMQAFLKENGHDPMVMQIIKDLHQRSSVHNAQIGIWKASEYMFTAEHGVISMDMDFFRDI